METFRVADILSARVAALTEPIEQFTAVADLQQLEVSIGETRVGTIISRHFPGAKQIALRVMAINGYEYHGNMKRRPNNAPSRVTLKLYHRPNDRI